MYRWFIENSSFGQSSINKSTLLKLKFYVLHLSSYFILFLPGSIKRLIMLLLIREENSVDPVQIASSEAR